MTLVEVVVAVAILVCAVLPIVDLFLGATRQARQTSDHGLAIAIEQKVAEDLRLASWENAHFGQTTSTAQPSLVPVVDARSPFFGAIEDTAPPLGRIRPGEDSGITTGPLFKELRTYQIGTTSTPRALPATGDVLDFVVTADWIDFRQARASTTLGVTLPGPAARPPTIVPVEDRALADEMIRQAFFPGETGRTLSQVLASTGGDSAMVRALGDAVVIVKGFQAQEVQFQRLTQALAKLASTDPDPVSRRKTQLDVARLYESQASAYLHALIYLAPRLELLSTSFQRGLLGGPPPPPNAYRFTFRSVDSLRTSFEEYLTRARRGYTVLYDDPADASTRPRVRLRLFMKVLNLLKLEIVTAGPEDVKPLRAMLTDFMDFHEGRNTNFFEFADWELLHAVDVPTLRKSYPARLWLDSHRRFKECAPAAIRRVRG